MIKLFTHIFNTAKAHIKGGKKYPKINGLITFKETKNGITPSDFKTQPSGNSGTKIACGIIQKN